MDWFMAVWPSFARDLELVKLVLVLVHQWNGEKPDLTRPSNTRREQCHDWQYQQHFVNALRLPCEMWELLFPVQLLGCQKGEVIYQVDRLCLIIQSWSRSIMGWSDRKNNSLHLFKNDSESIHSSTADWTSVDALEQAGPSPNPNPDPHVAYISITLTSVSLSNSAAVTSSSHCLIACWPNAAISLAWCLLEISRASQDFEHSVTVMPSIFLWFESVAWSSSISA